MACYLRAHGLLLTRCATTGRRAQTTTGDPGLDPGGIGRRAAVHLTNQDQAVKRRRRSSRDCSPKGAWLFCTDTTPQAEDSPRWRPSQKTRWRCPQPPAH